MSIAMRRWNERSVEDNLKLDTKLGVDNYIGKQSRPQIRAIRNYREKNSDKLREWSKNYYERNRDTVNYNHGRSSAIKRLLAGHKVSQKTIEKYNIDESAYM